MSLIAWKELVEMSSSWSNPQIVSMLFLVGCGFSSRVDGQRPSDAPDNPPIDGQASAADGPGGPPADWWNASWGHRHLIAIDMRKVPGNLTGSPLTGFPVLVKLTPQTFDYAAAKSDGSDLRFVLPDQTTVLPYDIDTFTSAGTSLVWVRMLMLMSGMPQQLFVYHGNAGAPAVASGPDVFASTHVSVHHLGADYSDATGHPHTGTPSGTPSAISNSPPGGARNFNGTTDYITLGGENDYKFLSTPAFTVSAWIRVTAFDQRFQAVVTKGDTSWRLQREDMTDRLEFGTTSGTNNDNVTGTTNVNDGQWHHAAVVYDGMKKLLYVDGAQDASRNYNLQLDQNSLPVSIGRNSESTTGGQRLWHGDIDEVRISSIPRAPAWIRAEYVTATDGSFMMIGPDQSF